MENVITVELRKASTTPQGLLASTSSSPAARRDVVSRMARLSVDQFPHGLTILGEDGAVLEANGQAETIFGYSSGEMVGIPISLLLPEQTRLAHADLRAAFWKSGDSRT